MTEISYDDYLLLSSENWFPRIKRTLEHLGIFFDQDDLMAEMSDIIQAANAVGITHGRITAILDIKFSSLIDALDAINRHRGFYDDPTILEDGVSYPTLTAKYRNAIDALIKEGALDGTSKPGDIKLCILPASSNWRDHKILDKEETLLLEPVGQSYGKPQYAQKASLKRYARRIKTQSTGRLIANEASLAEIVFSTISDSLYIIDHDVAYERVRTLNNGYFRSTKKVPLNVPSYDVKQVFGITTGRLFIGSRINHDYLLHLKYGNNLGAEQWFALVYSIKKTGG